MRASLIGIAQIVLIAFGIADQAQGQTPSSCPAGLNRPGTNEFNLQLHATLPAEDYLDLVRRCVLANYPKEFKPPEINANSPWIVADRELHSNALSNASAEIMVVPFQIQGYGIDRIHRMIMTTDLAYELGRSFRVADPFLISRALGVGRRRIPDQEVLALAGKMKVKYVVLGYVGHENRNALSTTIKILTLSEGKVTSTKQKDWKALTFSPADPPFMVFHQLLPQVVQETLPTGVSTAARSSYDFKIQTRKIELSPLTLSQDSTRKVPAWQSSLLLAALAAPAGDVAFERLNTRALLLAMRAKNDEPMSRFARAYLLSNLQERPSALRTLQGLSSPRDRALVALLNGNLPSAERARLEVKDDFEKLLIDLKLQRLRDGYGRTVDADFSYLSNIFGSLISEWGFTLETSISSHDQWNVPDATDLKVFLDRSFPIPDFSADALLRANDILRSSDASDELGVDVATLRHLRQAIRQNVGAYCCKASSSEPNPLDVLTLIEGQLETRIVKWAYKTSSTQGMRERAWSNLQRYVPNFAGLPSFEVAKAQVAIAISEKSPSDTKQSWAELAEASAMTAVGFSYGQTQVGSTAFNIYKHLAASPLTDAYGNDFPSRPYWKFRFYPMNPSESLYKALLLEAWDYSESEPDVLRRFAEASSPDEFRALIDRSEERLVGLPARDFYLPRKQKALAPSEQTEAIRAAIKNDPMDWENYITLGDMLIEEGNFKEAANVYSSFPGFKDMKLQRPVELSNRAYGSGSRLYWKGYPELAAPLYKIAADLNTGSDASMSSAIRLRILDGDYAGAAEGSLARARRYDDEFAYRDYLSFLHAFGQGDQAWAGFSRIKSSFEVPQAWISALVGHRKDGASEATIRKWYEAPAIRDAKFEKRTNAPWYAILANSVDRLPPRDLGNIVFELDKNPRRILSDGLFVSLPYSFEVERNFYTQPSALRKGQIKPLPEGTVVKSELAYFADAYALLRHGQFGQSADAFAVMANHYEIENGFSFALGYFAQAAAKSGDKYGLAAFLERNGQMKKFDHWLARAIFAGAKKDIPTALSAVNKAFNVRPNSGYQPIPTEYQYAEACEWLYRETSDKRFIDLLLTWAKVHQRIQPPHAWPYAMEYTYAVDPQSRIRALALTRYLDPLSPRIAQASAADVEKAKTWLRANNPFDPKSARPPVQAALN